MRRGKNDKRNCCLDLGATRAHERSLSHTAEWTNRPKHFLSLICCPTCLCCQAPDEAAETVNLSQQVSLTEPEEAAAAAAAEDKEGSEEDKNLPEWSEKVASGILTGRAKQVLHPEISSASEQQALVFRMATWGWKILNKK